VQVSSPHSRSKMATMVAQPPVQPAVHSMRELFEAASITSSSLREKRLGVSVQGHSQFHVDAVAEQRPRRDLQVDVASVARTESYQDVTGLQVESAATLGDDASWPPTSSPGRKVDALLSLQRCASAPSPSTTGRISSSKTLEPMRTASERGALNYVKEQECLMESARALARTPSRPVATEAGGKSPQLALFLSVESWGSSCHEGTARYGKCSPLRALKI